ncbi:MAG: hypothetical protein COA52_08050 [Hyphomicrobiales bacterium]|nr:cupin domain-containing protein [Hyphomicrobiales bacterium]PCJ91918.1 MAG: hypothetical protein COA52_08050 [Hyphomicrobiales bacterium]
MKIISNYFNATGLAILLAASTFMINTTTANSAESSVKLLTAHFDARQVVQVEVGDFHFTPGQVAPIHTHSAPAVGYVAKGAILYQVEGEKPQLLRAGDVFFEPVGPRILRFDNASATEEAIFLDFNLEQEGEPFIVFEEPPKDAIDPRTLPTIDIVDQSVDQVSIFRTELASSETLTFSDNESVLGIVAQGVIELQIPGQAAQRIVAGSSFSVPAGATTTLVANASSEVSAKIITFRLQ